MKKILFLSAFLTLCLSWGCKAQAGRFTFGVEWGCDVMYISYIDYNYIGEDGSNVSENSINWHNPHVGGFVEGKAGFNAGNKFNVSILAGIKGLGKESILCPLDLRLSFLPKGVYEDGAVISCGAGISFGSPRFSLRSLSALLSAGYRHSLEGGMSIDLFGGLRVSTDHPTIYDGTAERYVPEKDIRKNDALYGSVVFGIAFNFR